MMLAVAREAWEANSVSAHRGSALADFTKPSDSQKSGK